MSVKATITEIMETWPLQLTVEEEGGRTHHILLSEQSEIERDDQRLSPHQLAVGHQIEVEGRTESSASWTARRILVLGRIEPTSGSPPEIKSPEVDPGESPPSVQMPPPIEEEDS